MRLRAALGITLALLASSGVWAASAPSSSTQDSQLAKQLAKVKSDCNDDLQKYCKGVTPGEGKVASCLDSREDQLSSTCRNTWLSTKARVSVKLDQQELAFRDSCHDDIQKFCSDVPSGGGRLLGCLTKHTSDLSSSCQNFQNTLNERISSLLG